MTKWLTLLSMTAALTCVTVKAFSVEKARTAPYALRASRVFEFDRRNPGIIPRHKVTALSMAVAFQNSQGALDLLAEIEPTARN